jgi:hypothetical protein
MPNEYLILTGSLSLTLALIEAWLLVIIFTNPSSAPAKLIPGPQDLLKSHIDYLLMALFLFAFYMLFSHFQIEAPSLVILSMCLGAIGNPGLFLIRAINPSLKPEPTPAFRALMGVSCVLTTVGYLGGAWLVAASAYARL